VRQVRVPDESELLHGVRFVLRGQRVSRRRHLRGLGLRLILRQIRRQRFRTQHRGWLYPPEHAARAVVSARADVEARGQVGGCDPVEGCSAALGARGC